MTLTREILTVVAWWLAIQIPGAIVWHLLITRRNRRHDDLILSYGGTDIAARGEARQAPRQVRAQPLPAIRASSFKLRGGL